MQQVHDGHSINTKWKVKYQLMFSYASSSVTKQRYLELHTSLECPATSEEEVWNAYTYHDKLHPNCSTGSPKSSLARRWTRSMSRVLVYYVSTRIMYKSVILDNTSLRQCWWLGDGSDDEDPLPRIEQVKQAV